MSIKKKLAVAGLAVLVVSSAFSTVSAQRQREITVISREESSGTRGAFDELMKITDGKTNMLFAEAVIVSSTDEVASKVEVDKFAIGYTSLGSVNNKIKALSIDGVAATEANVKNGSYKIARPFVLATKKDGNNKIVADFIKFTTSTQAQAIVAKGYVTIDGTSGEYKPSGLVGKITLSGSTSVERIIEKLKEEYVKLNPKVRVEINYNGSSAGINDCLSGKSDIAMSSRELKDAEKGQLNGSTFALDGIAVIVNKSNPMSNIKAEDVTKIFKGGTRQWSAFGVTIK